MVDTGATLTVIPYPLFRKLGLKPTGEKVRVSTAGGPDELNLADALIRIDGKERILPVLVSRKVNQVLLGVVALEAMQLKANPVTQRLEKHTALLYSAS